MHPEAKALWASIRNPNCEECPLHESAQSVCLIGDGPVASARYIILGEAPGYREDDIAIPFSGKSGRYLDSALANHGLDRSDAFVSNVAKCRPPDNRTPHKSELRACRHYLDDEWQAVNQQAPVLLLGNSALSVINWARSGIMKHRGKVQQVNGRQVMATVHPAAVLRNPRMESLFNTDLATFARLVKGQPSEAAPGHTYLVNTKAALVKMCKAIMASEAVAYDLETNGFDEYAEDAAIATIAVATSPGVSYIAPIHHPEAAFKRPLDVLNVLGHCLVYTSAKRIAHNAKFDDRWLNRFGIPVKADFDTMIAAHILDENRYKSLKVLAPMLLGVDQWSIDVAEGRAMTEPLRKVARYNGLDADYTLRLYYEFKAQLLRPENRRLLKLFAKLMMPGSRTLTDIEQVGLWLDMDRLQERRIEVRRNLDKVNKKLVKIVGYQANWNSTQQLSRILFEELKLPILEVTAKANPSTREAVLLQLRHEYEVAALILEYRKWAKYDSTYFESWLTKQHEGRLHANYKITGTVTGRLSSGKEEGDKSRGLNAQQIPRDKFIRSVIGAPEGWTFVEADFSQLELRLVAHYSRDPTMMRIFQMGGDIHMTTAMQITGKPAAAIEPEERKKAKGVNFGYVFGMGWRKFIIYCRDSYDVVVTDEEAQYFRKQFFSTFSKLPAWHARQRRVVRNYQAVSSVVGRIRHLPDILSEDEDVQAEAERQAINSPVQGLGSDMMLTSLNLLHARMNPKQARIVGTVHDSGLFEIRSDKVDKWVPIIRDTMEHLPLRKMFGAGLSVPIKVDIKIGTHWGEGVEV